MSRKKSGPERTRDPFWARLFFTKFNHKIFENFFSLKRNCKIRMFRVMPMLGIFFFIHLEEFRELEEYIQDNRVGCTDDMLGRDF